MGARGRTSTAELAVVHSDVVAIERALPPDELNDEHKAEWLAVVNRLPADWFPRETHSMLAQYCRHVVSARRVANLIANLEASDDFDLDQYDKLLKMQEREGRAMSSLATRMRITQQATVNPKKTKGTQVKKPWQK